jgi:hypothetical protein
MRNNTWARPQTCGNASVGTGARGGLRHEPREQAIEIEDVEARVSELERAAEGSTSRD